MKIVFMGTPDFAVPALQCLIESAEHEVICVYTQPPRPKGRGMEVQKSPVHIMAESHGIEVRTPKSLRKDAEAQSAFAALNADIGIVAAYGLLLPLAVLDAPYHGCLNIHASLLPRWRGASPIQHAIWKGDSESGVTIMQMEEGLDTGPMIAKAIIPIHDAMTNVQLHEALSIMGGPLVMDVLKKLDNDGDVRADIQDETLTTFAPLLKKTDGEINPTAPAAETYNQIRALNPWPGTFVTGKKGRVKILSAHMEGDDLVYTQVQPDGKKPMDLASARNGGYL